MQGLLFGPLNVNNDFVAIQWMLDNAGKLDLSVDAYKWDLPFESKILDCKVKIKINGQVREGRGSAHTEEHALLKAFSEAVDRVAFFEAKKYLTTNGLAVHTSLNDAIRSARCELIERDSLFCHFLTMTPFKSTPIDLNSMGFNSEIFEFLQAHKIEFKLAEMQSIPGSHCFVFMAHGLNSPKKLGFMFGMGCNLTAYDAAKSAIFEGLRHVIANLTAPHVPSITEKHFLDSTNWGPDEHMALANELTYANSITPLFFNTSDTFINPQASQLIFDTIPYEHIQLPGELEGAPFFAVKAYSKDLQDIYFGPTKQESVNLLRLSEFAGKSWTWNMVNKTPHPLA